MTPDQQAAHKGQSARHAPDPTVNGGEPYGPNQDQQRCPCGAHLRLVGRRWQHDPQAGAWA